MNPDDTLKKKDAEKRLQELRSSLKAVEKDDNKQDEKRSIESLIRIEERILDALDQGHQITRLFSGSGERRKLLGKIASNQSQNPSSPTYQSINQRQEIIDKTMVQTSSSLTEAANFERAATELAKYHENYFTNSLVSFFRCCFCCPEQDEEEILINRKEATTIN